MSGAEECYGVPSLRMGLQAINQTRSLAGVITPDPAADPPRVPKSGPALSVLRGPSLPTDRPRFVRLSSKSRPRPHGALFFDGPAGLLPAKSEKDGDKKRGRRPRGLLSASINGTVFSHPWM